MARRVLVTGGSGRFGGVVVRELLSQPLVERVVNLDLRPSQAKDPRLRHHMADIRSEYLLRAILEEERIDTVFHFACATGEPRDQVLARETNVGGTLCVLEACDKSPGVRKLIVASSASAYGARWRNPEFLSENDPLRASTLREGIDKRLMEEELQKSLPAVRTLLQVSILRLCTILGPAQSSASLIRSFCALPAAPSVALRPGGLQFLAESEAAGVMIRIMESPEARGVFNVAPDDYVTLPQLCRALGKRRVPVPYWTLWTALLLARCLSGRGGLTERAAGSLAYPLAMSNAKLKRTLGLKFPKSSLAAFLDLVRSQALVSTP